MDLLDETKDRADAMGVSLNAYCLLAIRNFNQFTADKPWAGGRRTKGLVAAASRAVDGSPGPSGQPPPRVGRNDPCPCGSGRKAKLCHPVYC